MLNPRHPEISGGRKSAETITEKCLGTTLKSILTMKAHFSDSSSFFPNKNPKVRKYFFIIYTLIALSISLDLEKRAGKKKKNYYQEMFSHVSFTDACINKCKLFTLLASSSSLSDSPNKSESSFSSSSSELTGFYKDASIRARIQHATLCY